MIAVIVVEASVMFARYQRKKSLAAKPQYSSLVSQEH